MSFYSDEFDEEVVRSIDLSNPELQAVASHVLCESLSEALSHTATVDELWQVFREILTQYQHAVFVDSLSDNSRREIYGRVLDNEYSQLRKLAIRELIRNEGDELREEAVKQIKAQIWDEDEMSTMREEIEARLVDELRPAVENQLKVELMATSSFVAEVKNDLKKTILGL